MEDSYAAAFLPFARSALDLEILHISEIPPLVCHGPKNSVDT